MNVSITAEFSLSENVEITAAAGWLVSVFITNESSTPIVHPHNTASTLHFISIEVKNSLWFILVARNALSA